LITFKGLPPPGDPAQLPAFLLEMQRSIEQAAVRADPTVSLQYLEVAPDRPMDGLYLSAAGVLGTNRGLYRYDSSVPGYTFIG
jgi:hypothetical protein